MMERRIISLISQKPEARTNFEMDYVSHWLKTRCGVFNGLPSDTYYDIIKNCGYRRAKQDDVIIKQGDPGDNFYIMLCGRASVYIKTRKYDDFSLDGVFSFAANSAMQRWKGRAKVERLDRSKFGRYIMRIESGKGFGELALCNDSHNRNASVISDEVSDLIVVPRDLFNRTLKDGLAQEYRERQEFIKHHSWFTKWNARFLRLLEMNLEKKIYHYGDTIVKQGDLTAGLIFIISGQAKIIVDAWNHFKEFPILQKLSEKNGLSKSSEVLERTSDNRTIDVCMIGKHQIVGDIELTFGFDKNTATVMSMATTVAFTLNSKNCDRLILKRNPGTMEPMSNCVLQKLYFRQNTSGRVVPLYRHLYQHLLIRKSNKIKAQKEPLANDGQKRSGIETKGKRRHIQLFLENQSPLLPPYLDDTVFLKYWSIKKNNSILRECTRRRERYDTDTKSKDRERCPRSISYLKNNTSAQQTLLGRPITAIGSENNADDTQQTMSTNITRPQTSYTSILCGNNSRYDAKYRSAGSHSNNSDSKKFSSISNQLDQIHGLKESKRLQNLSMLLSKEDPLHHLKKEEKDSKHLLQRACDQEGRDSDSLDSSGDTTNEVNSDFQTSDEYLSSLESKVKTFCTSITSNGYRRNKVNVQSLRRFKVERSSQVPRSGGTVLVEIKNITPIKTDLKSPPVQNHSRVRHFIISRQEKRTQ